MLGGARSGGCDHRAGRTRALGALTAVTVALGVGLGAATIAPAADEPTQQPATQSLLGINVSRGHVQMLMLAPVDSTVTFFEEIDGARTELGTSTAVPPATGGPDGAAPVPVAIPWRCDRTTRRFHAVARTTDGRTIEASNEALTPSCRDRVAIVAPKQVQPGSAATIQLKDRWQLGDLPVRVCVGRKPTGRRCTSLRFEPGQRLLSFRRNVGAGIGDFTIDLYVSGFRTQQRIGVGRAATKAARQGMLITGDSMMQGIDALLADRLEKDYRIIRQTRPGTGISKDLGKKWTVLAREQAARHKPAVTVVLLGGNDGFPMKNESGVEIKCCSEAWRQEYLRRLEEMATAYARNGRGTVLWSLLPPTRREDLTAPISAVNDAIRRLAARMPAVRLVPLDKVFGPGYRDTIDGEKVRDPDGLHFSLAGQRLATQAILSVLRTPATTPTGR
ncbi:DUF459 domain-containing protein [Conexibacter sp. W3-3-2]|uniref:Uncharacterized protein n=1 Tax=Paraconexibacter algicola TaxID=2133960 RepID=A0A2T4UHZ2_9ACTN|nr:MULTISPECIES: GDSL-type esterase/lipase family protein [Solirubrobacterales]MTD45173.1 DUF459 domain-containing protein [Conexibacter sp. W3-3-2]PTL58862.1 hypothetical protein C7Y72_03945 [Paraconexibacter algicola]